MMRLFAWTFFALLALLAGGPALPVAPAYAQSAFAGGWSLQPDASKLNFQTIKSQTIVESDSFASLRGEISPDGVATVTISLDSVSSSAAPIL